jgi:hypothetical protein
MNKIWLGIALALVSGHVCAQVGELYDADIIEKTAITDPARAVAEADGHWMAFRMPVLEGTRSPCCWKGKWNRTTEVGCSLESSHQSYGTRSDSPLVENVIVYSEIRAGQVQSLRVVGESCPVEGNGAKVTWIDDINNKAGLNWLESIARSDEQESAGESALYAFALHRSPDASQRLYSLAKETNEDLSEEAIFWLGEARGEEGFKVLKQLLAELPRGDTRREINFALAQNHSTEASELLHEISKSDRDPEQRSEAMFWLAQEYPELAKDWLLEVINTEQDEDVLEEAVFAISQLPGESGDLILLDLAKNEQAPKAVRRQALFWLANSDNEDSIAALTELLTR